MGLIAPAHYDPERLRLLAITLSKDDLTGRMHFFLQTKCNSRMVVNEWKHSPLASDRKENAMILTPRWMKRIATALILGAYSHTEGLGGNHVQYRAAHLREQYSFFFARNYFPPS